MTLYDHYQVFDVYVTNAYDENLPAGYGERDFLMEHSMDGCPSIFDVLMLDVEIWHTNPNNEVVVLLNSEEYNIHVENLYSESYVQTWDWEKPETRPYRTLWEVNHPEKWRKAKEG